MPTINEDQLRAEGWEYDPTTGWRKPKRGSSLSALQAAKSEAAKVNFLTQNTGRSSSEGSEPRHVQKKAEARTKVRHGPVMEQGSFLGTLGAACVQKGPRPNILIKITSIRKRLLDEDNLCEKYVVDLLRNSGVIFDDAPDKTKIEVSQRKTESGEEEFNLIEVYEL